MSFKHKPPPKLNCTLKIRQKSNDWGAFCMKLSYKDKVQIYKLRQNGESINSLSKKFSIDKLISNIGFD
ncbi:hypothetical protein CS010_05920 [Streptococcus macedonicus]|uniref:Uncharacterized protein n=1 Tax=Streptococcus macedonicus TaxID=59310 RepID=A0A2G3NU60_STRMC|nr:hypothetical protein CS010_05920 [Streptococcus macedonicus]PHV59344.1 hypothetical protein CS005_09620 [Streptococcus macedonicus]